MKPTLLIVDDDEEIRAQMKWALAKDYEVLLAEDRNDAVRQFQSGRPIVTLLDLGLPPRPNDPDEGLEAISSILAMDDSAKIIVVSGQEEKANALRAVGAGAHDFFLKPVDMAQLSLLIQRCVYVATLEREYRGMRQTEGGQVYEGMLAGSSEMRKVFGKIDKIAKSSAPVLLLGESGTGKEMVAKAIHRRSGRSERPFVAINCNAIPESLLESELFGHEKGAFTGAHMRRKGLIEGAEGGTLFLDEIGDLPAPIQVKLLRFLQEQEFHRVGGREELRVDARVIAATNSDLKEASERGEFREDLYFRLAVVVLSLPPLRERGSDIALLAQDFLERFAAQNQKQVPAFSPDTLRAIASYPWPGNIRELQNRIQRAVILAEGNRITVDDLELQSDAKTAPTGTLKSARENLEREMVQEVLERHGGKITSAAAELGISRPTLYDLMDKLQISKE